MGISAFHLLTIIPIFLVNVGWALPILLQLSKDKTGNEIYKLPLSTNTIYIDGQSPSYE